MRQIAALPYTSDPIDGSMQILLITSRDTGRWVIPKGNIDSGQTPHGAAVSKRRWRSPIGSVEARSPALSATSTVTTALSQYACTAMKI